MNFISEIEKIISAKITCYWGLLVLQFRMPITEHRCPHVTKTVVRCHEAGGNALTVCMLPGLRASSILVKGSANLLSFHTTPSSAILNEAKIDYFPSDRQQMHRSLCPFLR